MRKLLPLCMCCQKTVEYMYSDGHVLGDSENLSEASYVRILSGYGSRFDMLEHRAVICDDCLNRNRSIITIGEIKKK